MAIFNSYVRHNQRVTISKIRKKNQFECISYHCLTSTCQHDLTSTNLASSKYSDMFFCSNLDPLQLPGDIVVGIGIRIDAPHAHVLQKSQRLLPEACIPQIDGPCQGAHAWFWKHKICRQNLCGCCKCMQVSPGTRGPCQFQDRFKNYLVLTSKWGVVPTQQPRSQRSQATESV